MALLAGCQPPGESADSPDTAADAAVPPQTVAEWPLFRGDPGLAGFSPGDITRPPSTRWRVDLGQRLLSTPVIADGRVFASGYDGLLYALDIEDGSELWRFDNGFGFEASPLYHDGRIYIGALDGNFYCLDADTGELLWERVIEGKIAAAANRVRTVSEDGEPRELIVFGAYDTILYALEADTGASVWTHATDNYINGTPAIAESGQVVAGGCDALLHILHTASGEPAHAVSLNTHIPSSAATKGGIGYAGNHEAEFFAVDLESGEILWRFAEAQGSYMAPPALAGDIVLAANDDHRIYAMDRLTGDLLWSFDARGAVEGGPLVIGETILAATSLGYLHAIDPTGTEIWTLDLGASLVAAPAVAGNTLYLGDKEGFLHALDFSEK